MKLYKVREIYVTLWTTMRLVLFEIYDKQKPLLYILEKCLKFSILSAVCSKLRVLFLS